VDKETGRFVVEEFGRDNTTAAANQFTVNNLHLEKDEANPPPRPVKVSTSVALEGVYRGHRIGKATPIAIHRGADLIALEHPRALDSGVAIHADSEVQKRFADREGAITIVLDFSGSMEYAKQAGGPRRIDKALGALEKVLRSLQGVTVSVWCFSHYRRGAQTPEDTIEQVRAPASWNPNRDLDDLMQKLRRLRPYDETPLARAMAEVAADLRGREGFKTLLVLTDGMDNRFVKGTYPGNPPTRSDGDSKYNPNSRGEADELPDFLKKEFANSGIVVNMILFEMTQQEGQQARKQFKVIETLSPPGNILEAEETEELVSYLKDGIIQELRCRLESLEGWPVEPRKGLLVRRLGGNPEWFYGLKPGVYRTKVHTSRQEISLARGDFLLTTLTRSGDRLGFRRALFADDYPGRFAVQQDDWQLAVLQNGLLPSGSLQMLAVLENTADRDASPDGTLKLVKPKFAWFEVRPREEGPRLSLRWGNLERYPAYAAGLEVPEWPTGAEGKPAIPVLDVWWTKSGPPAADRWVSLTEDLKEPRQVAGKRVVIESIQFESRRVVPDQAREYPCLVVRLRYAKGSPVLVQLRGQTPEGQEHRLYKEADKYTGIFWPVSEDQAKNLTLGLIPLEQFKKEAQHSRLVELRPPDPQSDRGRIQAVPEPDGRR
jgi:Mg-chelatase subunit ChlD